MESKSSACSRVIRSRKVTMRTFVRSFSSDLLCLLHSLPGFPKRLEDMFEPNSSLFRILAKNVEGIALEGTLYARELWHPGLDLGCLGEGGPVVWVEAVRRVREALEDGQVLGKGKVDRCYAGRHRSWVKVGDLAYVGLC